MIRKFLAFLGELLLHTHNDDRKDSMTPLFRRSTDAIVGPLSKIVKKLDAHAARQNAEADRKADVAIRLQLQAQEHTTEAGRALAARDKIAGLLG